MENGFVLSESVRYPWGVINVVLNSAGVFLVLGLVGGVLLGGWKRAPSLDSPPTSKNPLTRAKLTLTRQEGKLGEDIEHSSLLTTLLIQLYFLLLLFGASTSAAVLRRHLMVWKVFAPRFMAAVVELGVVDLGVVVAWGVPGVSSGRVGSGVVRRVVERVGWVLGRIGIGRGGGVREKDE